MSNFIFERLNPAQVAMLLPTGTDIQKLADLCRASEEGWNPERAYVIRGLILEIAEQPYLPALWIKLAMAFEGYDEVQWKYFYLAHEFRPASSREDGMLDCLASVCNALGDYEQAMALLDRAIDLVEADEYQQGLIEHRQVITFIDRQRHAMSMGLSVMEH